MPASMRLSMNVVSPKPASPTGTGSARRAASGTRGRTVIGLSVRIEVDEAVVMGRPLAALRPEIRAGTPVVALEPSCGAVFRDELQEMLPTDEDAKRLARLTCSLGELLDRGGPLRPPAAAPLRARAPALPPEGDERHGLRP